VSGQERPLKIIVHWKNNGIIVHWKLQMKVIYRWKKSQSIQTDHKSIKFMDGP
jgi:hypothetical protein